MDFRTIGDRTLRRPIFDIELPVSDLILTGQFDYDEYRADDLDQVGVTGAGSLHHVILHRASLAESRFTELELMDVEVRHTTLPNSAWEQITARRVEFVDCQAVGLQLGLAKAEDLYFEGCKLDYARIDVEQHRGDIAFHRCTFQDAVLSGDLSSVMFSECSFGGAEFQVRRAAHCDVTSSHLDGASGLLTLAGAHITADQAVELSTQLATEIGFVIA